MKKLIMGMMIGMVLFGAVSTAVAEIEVTGDANVGIYSKYIWRVKIEYLVDLVVNQEPRVLP